MISLEQQSTQGTEITTKNLRRKGSCGRSATKLSRWSKERLPKLRWGFGQRIFYAIEKNHTLSESTRRGGLAYGSLPYSSIWVGRFLVDYNFIKSVVRIHCTLELPYLISVALLKSDPKCRENTGMCFSCCLCAYHNILNPQVISLHARARVCRSTHLSPYL